MLWKIRQLERENEDLKKENRDQYSEINHLNFRIDQELEPRLRRERRAYDNWVTNPELLEVE